MLHDNTSSSHDGHQQTDHTIIEAAPDTRAARQAVLKFQRDMGDAGASLSLAAKSRLIDQIQEWNPSAPATFLAHFSGEQLAAYLSHLTLANGPRGSTPWVRRPGSPAIVSYRPTA